MTLRRTRNFRRSKSWVFISCVTLILLACSEISLPFLPQETTPAPPSALPPAVVSFTPQPGMEVASGNVSLMIRFDQPMDRNSVETALRVIPETPGDFTWQGDRAFTFTPRNLAAGTRYQVLLSNEARSAAGVSLTTDLVFAFSTLAPLQVTMVSPAPDSLAARVDAPILITFNRPLVSISCAGEVAGNNGCPELPLSFSPTIQGQGSWVNPALYRFDARSGWVAGQLYVATLAAGISSQEGAVLAEPYSWSFTAGMPRILEISPADGALNQPLESSVRVVFSTPMDTEATASAFSLVDAAGVSVPGAVTWDDGGAILVFTPTEPLTLGTQYTLKVGERARALTSAPVENPQQASFMTAPYPRVDSVAPLDGDEDASVYEPVRFTLQGLFDAPDLASYLVITPTTAGAAPYISWDGRTVNLSWEREPRSEYCVTLLPGLPDRYGNVIQDSLTSCFTTGDLDPYFGVAAHWPAFTFDAVEQPSLYFLSRNVEEASFSLDTLSQEAFIQGQDAPGASLREWDAPLTGELNTYALNAIPLTRRDPLPTGYYQVSWTTALGAAGSDYVQVAVVDRHVTLKLAQEEALVWVTDLRSGEPITRTEVRLLDGNGVLVAAGTTDLDGVARIRIEPLANLWVQFAAVVGEPGRAGFGIALNSWNWGAMPRDFNLAFDQGPFAPQTVSFYADRPLYRAGQTLNFRGVVRRMQEGQYALPTSQQIVVTLRDPEYQALYTTQLPLSDAGTWAGAYPLPADAAPGIYTLEASFADQERIWSLSVPVQAYREPEFTLTVRPERSAYIQGDDIRVEVEAADAFGEVVNEIPVQWTVRAEPTAFTPDAGAEWSWGLQAGSAQSGALAGAVIASGAGALDADGRLIVTLSADLSALGGEVAGIPQRWRVEVTTTDGNGVSVTGSAALTVHPAQWYLGLSPQRWVTLAGQRVEVNLLALDLEEALVAEQAITVQLVQREWARVSASAAPEGYTWNYTDTLVSEVDATTDRDGAASVALIPPKSGVYVIAAESRDALGHAVRSELSLWVGGDQRVVWPQADGRVTPLADARIYRSGDTARVLVPTPFAPPFQILMAVERDGILAVQRFVAEESNPILEVPIAELYAPNIYVSLVVIKGIDETQAFPDVRVGFVNLPVALDAQQLTVELSLDRTTAYRPGDPITLTVRTRDAEGQPVDADVGLSVVDQALQSLVEPDAPGWVDGLYGARPLRVMTGDSLLYAFGRLAPTVDAARVAASLSLDGLGDGGAAVAAVVSPADFPDTAYWAVRLRTGPSGEIAVPFFLPDSLTTWVVNARAITAATQVGEATTEILVNKPLLVRPVTPRFFVTGDQPEVAAILYNHTGVPLTVTTRLDATGVTVVGDSEQAVRVEAGGRGRVAWKLTVPESAGAVALLTFSAAGGGYEDVARPTLGREPDRALPIYAYQTPDTARTAGSLAATESRLEALAVPGETGIGSELRVRLEPSLAATMVSGLQAVQLAPCDTTDTLVDQALVGILAYSTLSDLGLSAPLSAADLNLQLRALLDQLSSRQNADGGWSWSTGTSDVQMSAYAALALLEARRTGFAIPQPVLDGASDYLTQILVSDTSRTNGHSLTRAHALAFYVLTQFDRPWPDGSVAALYAARDTLGVTGRAYLTLALGLADSADPRFKSLLDDLRGEALTTGSGAYSGVYWLDDGMQGWATDTRATAVMVDLLTHFAPNDPLLPKAVRWLMAARQGNRWATTQETAWSLVALSHYLALTGESGAAYTWGIALNGAPLSSGEVTAENLTQAVDLHLAVADLLPGETNTLEIARGEGSGELYYTTRLMMYESVAEVAPEARGITVYREYCAPSAAPLTVDDSLKPCAPIGLLHPGDEVEVRLTLILPEARYYVVLEDPYPAGFGAVSSTLPADAASPSRGWWQDPFEHYELQDEQALFFATRLSAGIYQVTYRLRVALAGEYYALPARAYEAYFPEVWGRTGGTMFAIAP